MNHQELQILVTEYEEMNNRQRARIRHLEAQNSYLRGHILNGSVKGSTEISRGIYRLMHDIKDADFLADNGIRWA